MAPRTDARRLVARCAAAVLVLQPLSASVECAAWPARQSITDRKQMTVSERSAQQPETARRGLRAGRRRHSLAGRPPATADARVVAACVVAVCAARRIHVERKLVSECGVQQREPWRRSTRRGLRAGWRQNSSAGRLPATAGARAVAACVAAVRGANAFCANAFCADTFWRPNTSFGVLKTTLPE